MNYSTLSKAQKRLVDAFIQIKPELADSCTITRTVIEDIFAILYDRRASGGEKFGYPNWIVKDQKISRGLYRFPGPNVKESRLQTITSQNISQSKTNESTSIEVEKEFFQDIKRYGIISTEETV